MAFDPNILLAVANIVNQRRQQDIQKRIASPGFGTTLKQSFAQGLGEAPGRMLASLPGEFMANARQDASFAHEMKMEDIRNPIMPMDYQQARDLNIPGMQGIGGAVAQDPTGASAMDPMAGMRYQPSAQPPSMRANTIRAMADLNRPRHEREIEAMRQAGETARERVRSDSALALDAQRGRVTLPGQMAGEMGLVQPTGFAPVGGGGIQWPESWTGDAEAVRAAQGMSQIRATDENTKAMREIQRSESESKNTKREADIKAATDKLAIDQQTLDLNKQKHELNVREFEETIRSNAAKEKANAIGNDATTLRARRAEATKEIMAAEKAVSDPMSSIGKTDAEKAAMQTKIKELRAFRSAIDDKLDSLDAPAPSPAPGQSPGQAPGQTPMPSGVDQKLNNILKRLGG